MENRQFRIRRLRQQIKRFSPALFLLLALLLIGFSTTQQPLLKAVRTQMLESLVPVFSVLQAPVNWVKKAGGAVSNLFTVYSDNMALRLENATLKEKQVLMGVLEERMRQLSAQVHFQYSPSARYLTTQVVADTDNVFAQSVVILAGENQGVQKDNVVMAGTGVLGRIIQTASNASRVLLITDYTSRIPVMVGKERFLAVAVGDNQPNLQLQIIPEGATLTEGDMVYTAGSGGIFPAGLMLGVLTLKNKVPEIIPFAEQTNYVQVVDFGLSNLMDTK